VRYRADGGERLAAETQRRNRCQLVVRQLRGAVAGNRQFEIGAPHAAAIIGDADQALAAARSDNVDATRPGVERILDQFLHDAGGSLDNFAGGDPVDDVIGETTDAHGRLSCRREFSQRADLNRRR
jgi:hypothetical protein